MYKHTISIESQLQKISNENQEYRELWSTWNLNKKTLEPILNTIIKDYPHYSLHDGSHSESILLNIERMLGNYNIENLSPTDLWLLLHVAYLHDFGMVIMDTKIQEIWNDDNFKLFLKEQAESSDEDVKKAANAILKQNKDEEPYNISWAIEIKSAVTLLMSSYCRWQHADYSKGYILDIDKIWGIDLGHNGIIKKRLVSLIADISAIHTKQFSEVLALHKETNGFKNDYIHPRFIACLLRIGDALDLDNGRFNRYGETIFGKMPESSKIHLNKHEATKHVLVTNEVIEVEADCPDDATYRETRKWFDLLKNEIDNLHLNWSDIAPNNFTNPPKLASYKILRKGIEDSYELSNLKFSISQNKAFEIIEGSSIYKDKFSCIREIVQNAEDASKIQLWRDIKSGMYYSAGIDESKVKTGSLLPTDIPTWIYQIYTIQITVEKNEANNAVVSIMDHGTGISTDTLKGICNVGQSYYQKKESMQEIEEMPIWLRPTANFGIGIQSCFMVTDKITIYTHSNKDSSLKITFRSGKQDGYVNVETLQENRIRGSKVVIEMSNDLDFSYSLGGFTAKKLIKIEPFETNCIIMYKIIEAIFKECGSGFFDIKITSKHASFEDIIPAYLSENKKAFPNEVINDNFRYILNENMNTITVWYNNNLYKIELNKNSHGNVNVCYKGKHVSKTKINPLSFAGFIINVDIYGIPTKEALTLSREELTFYASKKICDDISKIIGEYFKLLSQNLSTIQDETALLDVFLLTSWLYEKSFPDSLFNKVSDNKNIRVVKFSESKNIYELDYCSLREISQVYPCIPYINCTMEKVPMPSVPGYMTETKLVQELNQSNIDKSLYTILIIDENIKRFLAYAPKDITYIKGSEILSICTINTNDNLYNPNDFTKKILLRKLVYDSKCKNIYNNNMYIMRRSIPAFEEFSKLAVNLKGVLFIGHEGYSNWNIISPISLNDVDKVAELSKDAFIEYVCSQATFKNIVEYTINHGKIASDETTIRNEYKRLIEAYYDMITTPKDE